MDNSVEKPDPSAVARAMYARDDASRALGIAVEVEEAGRALARMRVTAAMTNGFDVCHGGLIFTLADTAFAFACNGFGNVNLAAAASIEFLKPARTGDELLATAEPRSRGRRSGIYDVTVTNQHRDTIALFRGRSHDIGQPHDL